MIVTPDFQSTAEMLNDSNGEPITIWKRFIDTNAPKKLILVSEVSFDVHFKQYSTYAITSKESLVEPWLHTPAETLEYAQKN